LPNTQETGFAIKQSNNLGPEFYIHSDGNVVIGAGGVAATTPILPEAVLHVSSSGDQALFRVDGATSGSVLFVTGSNRVGIGTSVPSHRLHVSGTTHLSGGVVHKRTAVTNNYSILLTDYYVGVDTSAGPVSLTIPAASTATVGQTYLLKDEGGNASTNIITINTAGGNIDGNSNTLLNSSYGAVALYTDGSDWFVY